MTLTRPSKSDTWLLLIIAILIYFMIKCTSCTQPEIAQPFPVEIVPIEGEAEVVRAYLTDTTAVIICLNAADKTSSILDFNCYDEARDQYWCVIGRCTLCAESECIEVGSH